MQTYPTTMEEDGGSSSAAAAATVMIPADAGDGGSTITAQEAKILAGKDRNELVPQLRFPPGYHFDPTDFELLDVYLRGKLEKREPQLDIFMDVDFLEWEPSKLIAERKAYGEDKYFFFTVRTAMKSKNDAHPSRMMRAGNSKATGTAEDICGPKGSWKATGSVADICRPGSTTEVVGTRRMLIYSSDCSDAQEYTMKEYVLTGSTVDDFVLCTVKLKQQGNATEKKDKSASIGKDKKASGDEGKKRKREAKPKKSTRKKKTTTTTLQPQETQQQDQNDVTPYISSDPLLLLALDQADHHQAWQEGDAMAFEETNLMFHAVAPHDEYPVAGGHQPCHQDASTQRETTWDGLEDLPIMQGYQASEQFHTLVEQDMSQDQFSTMVQFLPQDPPFQYQGQQQLQQPHNTSELLPLPHQLVQHQFHYGPTHGLHGNITLPQFLQESGKPPETSPESGKPTQTSPNTVLAGPEPGLPASGDDRPCSDGDVGMMNGVASPVVPQATSYASADHHRLFDPVNFPGHDFDHDNLAGNGGGSGHAAMELPEDHGRNRALYTCQHDFQWWSGEPQNPYASSCDWCVAWCALCDSILKGK